MAPNWSLSQSFLLWQTMGWPAVPCRSPLSYVLSLFLPSCRGHCGLHPRATHNPLPHAVIKIYREGILGTLSQATDWVGIAPSVYCPFSIQHAWNGEIMSNAAILWLWGWKPQTGDSTVKREKDPGMWCHVDPGLPVSKSVLPEMNKPLICLSPW